MREDELLYSWIARIHFASYSRSVTWTASLLFDTTGTFELKTLLPTGIEGLSKWLSRRGMSIQPDELISELTSYRYFANVLSDRDAAHLKECMVRGSATGLKTRFGLVPSRVGAGLTLRWCPHCTCSDISRYGVPHWRRSHQLPCVLVCASHGVSLQVAVARRRSFILPPSDSTPSDDSPPWLNRSIDFAKWSAWLAREFEGFGAPPHEYYRAQLRVAGYGRGRSQILAKSLESDIRDHYGDLRFLTLSPELDQRALRSFRWLPKLYRAPRGGQHPVFHLLLLSFLHESPANVARMTASPASTTGKLLRRAQRDNQIGLLAKLHASGASSNVIALTLGLSVTTVVELARLNGLEFTSRAKKITRDVRFAVTRALLDGDSPASVMSSLSLSSTTVRRIIRADAALRGTLRERNAEATRVSKRQAFRFLAGTRDMSASDLVRIRPDLYSWFRRNDSSWLEAQLTPVRRTPRATAPWRMRDAFLANQIRAALAILRSSRYRPKRISISEVVRQCSASRWIPKSLNKLPRTAALLTANIESQAAFRTRLFVWTFHQMQSLEAAPTFWRVAKATGIRSSFWSTFRGDYEALIDNPFAGKANVA